MSEDQLRRDIQDLKDGRIATVGEVALTSSATTTTVTRRVVSATSIVFLTPYDTGAASAGIPKVVPAKGSFVIHHANSTTTRTYRYAIFTGNT